MPLGNCTAEFQRIFLSLLQPGSSLDFRLSILLVFLHNTIRRQPKLFLLLHGKLLEDLAYPCPGPAKVFKQKSINLGYLGPWGTLACWAWEVCNDGWLIVGMVVNHCITRESRNQLILTNPVCGFLEHSNPEIGWLVLATLPCEHEKSSNIPQELHYDNYVQNADFTALGWLQWVSMKVPSNHDRDRATRLLLAHHLFKEMTEA